MNSGVEQPGVLVGPITRRSCGSNPTPATFNFKMNKSIKIIIHFLVFVDLLFLSTLSEFFAILFVLYLAYLILLGVKLSIIHLGKIMRGENKNKVGDKTKIKKSAKDTKI